jgi:hypothetical protein
MTQFETPIILENHLTGLLNEIFNEIPATLSKTMREDVFGFPPVNITEKTMRIIYNCWYPVTKKINFRLNWRVIY